MDSKDKEISESATQLLPLPRERAGVRGKGATSPPEFIFNHSHLKASHPTDTEVVKFV
jgi:hypothetical protein